MGQGQGQGQGQQGRSPSSAPVPAFLPSPSLQFDAEFESGNLERAVRVLGRESLVPLIFQSLTDTQAQSQTHTQFPLYTPVPTPHTGSAPVPAPYLAPAPTPAPALAPQPVHQEYDLTLRTDLQTDGNVQWYYFKVTLPITYPLRVRFNIVNMQKKDSLYNYGMKPACFSVHAQGQGKGQGEDWRHRGEDVCYYRNTRPQSDKKRRRLYTLTFTYTFWSADVVYFAHSFPYTYSDLQSHLRTLDHSFLHSRVLTRTICGNACDLLTISERSGGMTESRNKPAIFLSARVHPGESNSSYIMHGFLDFITSDLPQALKLRRSFVFHIIPMLNPDGVIHGNYRCSLAGTDLNRRYVHPHPRLHPTIFAKKNLIRAATQSRGVLLYLDLHGHSKLKNSFCYGCDPPPQGLGQWGQAGEAQALVSQDNCREHGSFSYRDCAFRVEASKGGTGRVVCWRELGIPASYTIEASFCG
ncbi:hypothetical protein B484DRAFT_324669, partial [Ochromonadaceae sp. CCMP2298]